MARTAAKKTAHTTAKSAKKGSDASSGMAPTSTRSLWKGAISFGLVHIPVALYSATTSTGVSFDWLDKRSMDPVGYKRYNKKTGKEVAMSDIVKGLEYENGRYVIVTPEELAAAYPKTTQTIEIEAFVPVDSVPFVYLEKPYYTAPLARGEKVYALLRETLKESDKAGIARVVISGKQHLAILIPCGPALVLNLLRWGGEVRSFEALELPPVGKANLKDNELKMARQLVEDMSDEWHADQFRDSFKDEIMRLVDAKVKAGKTEVVIKPGHEEAPREGAEIVDLTELLRRSLQGKERKAAARPEKEEPAIDLASARAAKSASTAAKKAAPARKAAAKKAAPVRKRA